MDLDNVINHIVMNLKFKVAICSFYIVFILLVYVYIYIEVYNLHNHSTVIKIKKLTCIQC